ESTLDTRGPGAELASRDQRAEEPPAAEAPREGDCHARRTESVKSVSKRGVKVDYEPPPAVAADLTESPVRRIVGRRVPAPRMPGSSWNLAAVSGWIDGQTVTASGT